LSKPKLVRVDFGEVHESELNKELKVKEESNNIFEKVIKSLRILKASALFRGSTIETNFSTFTTHGDSKRSLLYENIVLGEECFISYEDSKKLKSIFTELKYIDRNEFEIASNRLSYGIERRSNEDKILDYIIGLESLYLPDGYSELTFRLSLRIAFMLEKDGLERKKVFNIIKAIYESRSKITHGKKSKLTINDVSKAEDILRKSLYIYVEDSSKFTREYLEDIFFAKE
jgi:predicted transcriptional regulator YdeE